MRSFAAATVIVLLVSACGLVEVSPDTPTQPGSGGADATATTPLTDDTTTTTLSGCSAADAEIALLCEAVDLIQRKYVDDVADDQLVEPALEALAGLPEGGTEGDLSCHVDDDVARPVCSAIDAAEVDPLEGVETALAAMAFSLDPNSTYLDPHALELAQDDTTGQVEGIGALVNAEDPTATDPVEAQCSIVSATCRLVVVSTFQDGPAEIAGVLPGDAIVTVDGMAVVGLHIDEVTQLVRGPAGTRVLVGFERGTEIIEFEIERAAIDIPIAVWEMVGDIGYMRFNLFTENADRQVRQGLTELISAGATGIVFDLRDNPGGALQAAIEVTSEFLDEGLVVRTESPGDETTYEVTGDGVATDPALALWLLINRGSASASEVMAGVLGETGRAVVLGENTFGKNTVQQRFPLGNGGALKLTVARWVTPAGRDFGAVGITPDIDAEFPIDLTPTELVERVLDLTQ